MWFEITDDHDQKVAFKLQNVVWVKQHALFERKNLVVDICVGNVNSSKRDIHTLFFTSKEAADKAHERVMLTLKQQGIL